MEDVTLRVVKPSLIAPQSGSVPRSDAQWLELALRKDDGGTASATAAASSSAGADDSLRNLQDLLLAEEVREDTHPISAVLNLNLGPKP